MVAKQENIPVVIELHQERSYDRSRIISSLSATYMIIAGLFLATSLDASIKPIAIPGIITFLLGFTIFQTKDKATGFASTLSIATIWIAVTIYAIFVEYSPALMYLNLLPLLIGITLFDKQTIPKLTLFTIFTVSLTDIILHQALFITIDTVIISFLSIVAGVATYLVIDYAQGLVEWAVDSQNKNFVRAESFYSQGEELRKTSYELQKAKEQLEEVSQAKSAFLSNMSHELRTPLNMVIGYTSSMLNMPQMYNNQELPVIFRDDIELVQSSGEYLLTLINDILDLSKIESGKFEIKPIAFDIIPVLQGVMATTIGLVKDKSLQLKPDFPDKLPLIWGDPIRIRQILLNLMSNGVKYTKTGSVTLSVQERDGVIHIAVIDTGEGIPEKTIATIFDRFEQVQQNSEIQGTGLGLDISQRLAHMHDSEISIKSTVGVGSTFSFDLKLATAEQSQSYTDDSTLSELSGIKRFDTPAENNWAVKQTVLIVEDDSTTRSLLIRSFEAKNYIVFDVQNGNDVYDTASAILPDLIVLDIVLPDKDGWAALDDLKADEETANIPVIILSGHINDKQRLNEQVALCLVKPVDPYKVIQHADKILAAKQIN